jgi:hypothetical protein
VVARVERAPHPAVKVVRFTAADQSRDELVAWFDDLLAPPARKRRPAAAE